MIHKINPILLQRVETIQTIQTIQTTQILHANTILATTETIATPLQDPIVPIILLETTVVAADHPLEAEALHQVEVEHLVVEVEDN